MEVQLAYDVQKEMPNNDIFNSFFFHMIIRDTQS